MKSVFLVFFTLINFVIQAQSLRSVKVYFVPMFNNQQLVLDQALNRDNLTITNLKFYISNISFFDGEDLVWEETDSYHLVDIEEMGSMLFLLDIPYNVDASRLAFDLGVDSLANVSGALSGDLDPMHGMYWAWQSGYINFKVEGKSDKCLARKNKFQFHLGGFQAPNNTLQKITLPIIMKDEICVVFDIGELIGNVDLSKTYEIMSPRPEAVEMAQSVASLFKIVE